MKYIEVKTRKYIDSTIAQGIVDKDCVSAVLTTGKISKPAKNVFDENDIAYAENVPENIFLESEAQEEG